MEAKQLPDPVAWAQQTFGAAQLGDPRRTKRLVRLAAQMAADPQASLPRQTGGDWAGLKAADRLLRADGVTHEAISGPAWQQTRQQLERERGVLLLVHDDTELDYGSRPATQGLGPIGNGSHRGFFVHTVLALVPAGQSERVLGVLQQATWVRQPAVRKADGGKESSPERQERPGESQIWTRAVEQVGSPPEGEVWIQVAERYADRFAFLKRSRERGTFFLVRAGKSRRVRVEEEPGEPELDHLLDRARVVVGSGPRQHRGAKSNMNDEPEPPRSSSVGDACTCCRPRRGPTPAVSPCRCGWCVCGNQSLLPSSKPSAPLCPVRNMARANASRRRASRWKPWNGFCGVALPVETSQQAWQMIRHYQSRWPIEDFHRGLKTGCRLEQRHLQEQGSLENLLAIVSPIAARLLQLRNLAREEPQQPALAWVEPEEAQVIACRQGVALERLTIEQFLFSVAQLGG